MTTTTQTTFNFPRFGVNNSHWKGGKILTEQGYIRFTGGIYRGKLEHRVIMHVFDGKYHVHHCDGKPWHNTRSNLKVYLANDHNVLSARRKNQQRGRTTIHDITPRDLKYLDGRGVHVPLGLLATINESWSEEWPEVF